MAAHERISDASIAPTLIQQLAIVLPKDASFKIYHLSTPPTRTSSIYSAPPATRPDRTYCESHFLAVSIGVSDGREVLVYAVEILIYSTAFDSTFFVSKADSTGYLHLLGLAKGTPSPIRDITAKFLRHLVEQHKRENIRSVVSLFARAQDQYLFPGSIEYSGKHVLDDRGLVRWWCRVLDPLIEGTPEWDSVKGYLTVPGLDTHESTSFIPNRNTTKWTIGHPLQEISRHSDDVPLRCFIPHYPDDPKARFLDELDEEITKSQDTSGQWKSVKSIEQFWDMMAFRQECSAGRMVGFIWIVFTPKDQHQQIESVVGDSQNTFVTLGSQTDVNSSPPSSLLITPATSFNVSSQMQPLSSPVKSDESRRSTPKSRTPKKKLSGPIIPRQPRVKTQNKNYLLDWPESSAYYIWRPEGRGQIIVDESGYNRATELLLRLDFANLELATSSSTRWINEVRSGAWGSTGDAWGQIVTGTKAFEARAAAGVAGVATLNVGLMRRKRKDVPEPQSESAPKVNVLATGMVRKKAKA
ncbi:histone acetylation protein-domain-containing protein [Rhexocercosporidium sp. MPI-PUGE-AT-0058]|nr:histone acetylation protein-domain-containing protein [Rhexocercosporidium sp. MPI-PUGE-AT-0058]